MSPHSHSSPLLTTSSVSSAGLPFSSANCIPVMNRTGTTSSSDGYKAFTNSSLPVFSSTSHSLFSSSITYLSAKLRQSSNGQCSSSASSRTTPHVPSIQPSSTTSFSSSTSRFSSPIPSQSQSSLASEPLLPREFSLHNRVLVSSPSSLSSTSSSSSFHLVAAHGDEPEDLMQWEGMTPFKAMAAGATAGVTEHVCVFPVDTIKTRMQAATSAGQPSYRGVFHGLVQVAKTEGIGRLYRGVPVTALGAIPSHAAHFASYEAAKRHLGSSRTSHTPFANAMAGVCATLAHDAISTPMDVVKQRLQVYNSHFSGIVNCISSTFRNEGLVAFFASYPTTVLLNVPNMAVQFAAYEGLQTAFNLDHHDDHDDDHDDDDHHHHHNPAIDVLCGGLAGGLGGLVSNPVDVVKTRVQTQIAPTSSAAVASHSSACGHSHSGSHILTRQTAVEIARDIMREEGWRGFTRGATARATMAMPSAAICWGVYEAVKRLLLPNQGQKTTSTSTASKSSTAK